MKNGLLLIATTAGLSLPNFGFGQSLDTKIPTPQKLGKNVETKLPKIPELKAQSKNTTTTTIKLPRKVDSMKGGGVIDGGGGDEVGMSVQLDAINAVQQLRNIVDEQTYEKLRSLLNTTKYFVVDDQLVVTDDSGKQQFSAAQNFPSHGTVYVQRQRYGAMKDSARRQRLMGHELLSMAGVEKTGDYRYSSQLVGTVIIKANSKGEVLFNEFYDADPKGFMADSAADICQEKKTEFADQYYFVYCSYWRKPIKQGFSCNTSESSETDVFGHRWSYSHSCGDNLEYVYGLRVYGLGKNSELVWKTVFSSKAFGPNNSLSAEYESEEDAQVACTTNSLVNGDSMWTRPRCLVKQDGQQYYYEIQTQNPLLKD